MDDELLNWLLSLIRSHNFWATILGAIIGGLFALRIAKHQVKESERHHEKQRKGIVDHERSLNLINIQLTECRKAIKFLIHLPNALLDVNSILKDTEKFQENSQKLSDIAINLSSELISLGSTMKICDFKRSDIEECEEFRMEVHRILDLIPIRDHTNISIIAIELTTKIDSLHGKLIKKQEELIACLKTMS
ncbi:hypothetical protein [Bacillus sp. JCM 19034]|uniref:hypothetical protein n=1 Tax=Bacillus sp. JCM 19034 TaxID=1481928 RepID=UPI000782B47D|nr:hypothetical protein [Bacillus sp. JCM 19034]